MQAQSGIRAQRGFVCEPDAQPGSREGRFAAKRLAPLTSTLEGYMCNIQPLRFSFTVVFIAIPVAFILGACANAPQYEEPKELPFAKLRIRVPNPEAFSVHVRAINLAKCAPGPDIGWVGGGAKIDKNRINMPDSTSPQNGILERKIPTGQRVSFAPTHIFANVSLSNSIGAIFGLPVALSKIGAALPGSCRVPVFVPDVGIDYEMTIFPSPGSCSIKLEKLSLAKTGGVQRDEVVIPTDQYVTIENPAAFGYNLSCPK